jgi:hypothetical protein
MLYSTSWVCIIVSLLDMSRPYLLFRTSILLASLLDITSFGFFLLLSHFLSLKIIPFAFFLFCFCVLFWQRSGTRWHFSFTIFSFSVRMSYYLVDWSSTGLLGCFSYVVGLVKLLGLSAFLNLETTHCLNRMRCNFETWVCSPKENNHTTSNVSVDEALSCHCSNMWYSIFARVTPSLVHLPIESRSFLIQQIRDDNLLVHSMANS